MLTQSRFVNSNVTYVIMYNKDNIEVRLKIFDTMYTKQSEIESYIQSWITNKILEKT